MQAVKSVKYNNFIPSISVPLAFRSVGLPLGASILGGLFYTFSGKTKTGCTRRKKTMSAELNLSSSTVWRSMRELKEFVSPVENKPDTYTYKGEDGQFIRVPKTLLFDKFECGDSIRRLTRAEALVGGWVITQCDNMKKKKKDFTSSISEISHALNLSAPTVQSALVSLIKAQIVFLNERGINRYIKSAYHVHRKFLRTQKREKKSAAPSSDGSKVIVYKSYEQEKEERVYRIRRELDEARHRDQERVEHNYRRACEDKLFKEADDKIREISCTLAFAELRSSPEYPALKEEFDKYEKQRDDALKRLGLKEEDLRERSDDE